MSFIFPPSLVIVPAGIYLIKVNNGNRTLCEFCSKVTLKTPERRRRRRSEAFTVNFEQISHIVPVFQWFILNK